MKSRARNISTIVMSKLNYVMRFYRFFVILVSKSSPFQRKLDYIREIRLRLRVFILIANPYKRCKNGRHYIYRKLKRVI